MGKVGVKRNKIVEQSVYIGVEEDPEGHVMTCVITYDPLLISKENVQALLSQVTELGASIVAQDLNTIPTKAH
jgi:hypothetical protein